MKTYTVTIESAEERLTLQKKCNSMSEMLGFISSGEMKVRRVVGQTKKGKPRQLLKPLVTNRKYVVREAYCGNPGDASGGTRFDEVVGWVV